MKGQANLLSLQFLSCILQQVNSLKRQLSSVSMELQTALDAKAEADRCLSVFLICQELLNFELFLF